MLAATLALGLALGGELVVGLAGRGVVEESAAERLAAAGCSVALFVWTALVLALLSGSWLSWRPGRAAAVALSVGVLSLLTLLCVAGVATRAMSGSYLTWGAVQFCSGAGEHVAHAALGRYRAWLALALALAAGLGVLFGRLLRPAARRPAHSPRWVLVLVLALGPALGGLFARRDRSRFAGAVLDSAPLLALASSLDAQVLARPAQAAGPASSGLPLVAGRSWTAAASLVSARRPNVLLLMLESVSPGQLGYGGYHRDVSPEIDRLARAGLRMRRAWATATHSNYAQMAVLSSLFPRRGEVLDLYQRLDYPRVLLHDLFHQLGSATATISSQDESWQGMRRFQDTGTPTHFWHARDYAGAKIDTGPEQIVPDAVTVDHALDWLAAQGDGPWALYVNLQATHFPYRLPEGAARPFVPCEPSSRAEHYWGYPHALASIVRNRFDNALRYADEQAGRIRRYLEQTGQLGRTLWVITSDHGEQFEDHGRVTHGWTLYDSEARVPLVLHWPGHVEPADRDEPVSHLDILPTLLELIGLPPHPAFQGTSFARPAAVPGRAVLLNNQGMRFADAVVCWPYKLVVDRTRHRRYLFHLERDPGELDNLFDRQGEVAARLERLLGAQVAAQLGYYGSTPEARRRNYAPRLLGCPELRPGA
ncbi:MAG: sulfatase [Deltaproteobacteria bacterium]|nr:sulfatase [Deltaproteobacteria bacterium]